MWSSVHSVLFGHEIGIQLHSVSQRTYFQNSTKRLMKQDLVTDPNTSDTFYRIQSDSWDSSLLVAVGSSWD